MTPKQIREKPTYARGDVVDVQEDDIAPWTGTVLDVKLSIDTWYVSVQREDRLVWVVPAERVRIA